MHSMDIYDLAQVTPHVEAALSEVEHWLADAYAAEVERCFRGMNNDAESAALRALVALSLLKKANAILDTVEDAEAA